MRIYGDINRLGSDPTAYVIQVGPTPEVGTVTVVNGKFILDVPEGVRVPDPLPTSTTTLLNQIFQGLLPGHSYTHAHYNALLTGADSGNLDPLARFPVESGPPVRSWGVRAQIGRSGAPSDNGLAPNSVCIFPNNSKVTPPRPGLLITNTIDVSSQVPEGVNNFSVYWKIYSSTTSEDVMNYSTGTNIPALKTVTEIDQQPEGFEVYASTNDGGGYSRVTRMVPCTSCDRGTALRLAFVNHSVSPVFLASYAVLY
jgi:hypothetical protein